MKKETRKRLEAFQEARKNSLLHKNICALKEPLHSCIHLYCDIMLNDESAARMAIVSDLSAASEDDRRFSLAAAMILMLSSALAAAADRPAIHKQLSALARLCIEEFGAPLETPFEKESSK